MSLADHAYYVRRADEEKAHIERAETLEAKAAHRQLRDLYLLRVGRQIEKSSFVVHSFERA